MQCACCSAWGMSLWRWLVRARVKSTKPCVGTGGCRLALARAAALVGELRDDAIAPPRHDVIAPAHFGAIVYAVAPLRQEPGWKADIGPLRRVASFDALFRPEHFANLEPEKISALQQLKEVSTLHPQPAAICGHIARRTLHLFGAGYRRPLRCWQC